MKFTRLAIPDVILIEPVVHEDSRGFFFESYNREEFVQNGILEEFVQDNQSSSSKGVVRGLHYQAGSRAQAKLVRVLNGEVFDVVVDIRKGSKTFGKYLSSHLSAENRKMIYIPAGFAHGFCALRNDTEVLYKVSNRYSPSDERGIFWRDAEMGIAWPKLDVPYQLSEKDRKNPSLRESLLLSKSV